MNWLRSTAASLMTSSTEKANPVRIQPSALNGPQRRMLADEMNITAMDIMRLFTEEELFDIAAENDIECDSIGPDHEDLARAVTGAVILRRVDWEAELPQEIEKDDPAVPVISDWDLDEMQQLEQEAEDAREEVAVLVDESKRIRRRFRAALKNEREQRTVANVARRELEAKKTDLQQQLEMAYKENDDLKKKLMKLQAQPEYDDRIDPEDEPRHADQVEEHVEEVNVITLHVKTLKRQAEEEIDSLNNKLRRTGEPSGTQDVPLAALEPDCESVNGEDASD